MDAVLREGGYAELMHLYTISATTDVVLQSYMLPALRCMECEGRPNDCHTVPFQPH